MDSLKIHIIGVHHSDDSGCKRIEEIGYREKPDAIFIEAPTKKLTDSRWQDLSYLFLRNPLLFLLYLIMIEFLYRIGFMKRIDYKYAKKVAEKLHITIYPIDDEPSELLRDDYRIFPIISWILILFLPVILFFFDFWLIIYWIIGVANYSLINLFATVPKRNHKMKERLIEIVKKNNYQNVMLITGKGHVGHFKKIFSSSNFEIKIY